MIFAGTPASTTPSSVKLFTTILPAAIIQLLGILTSPIILAPTPINTLLPITG